MTPSQQIIQKLKDLKIDFILREHPEFLTCDDSRTYYEQHNIEGKRAKNLFLRNKNGKKHFLLILPQEKDYDKPRFKEISTQKCGFADSSRMDKYLKTYQGAVSPFGLLFDEEQVVKLYIDKSLLENSILHFHPNQNNQSIQITADNLLKFLKAINHEPEIIEF